ncbi:hypothetical protein MMC29_007062 [Sticta canariensis]|nr:hypothetical protein [Sticta canariensis]
MFVGPFCICSVPFVNAFSVLKSRGFDPTLQHVEVSGAHRFIAPTASDLRGPCPAMNAAANHGYIARNGYTTLQESRDASVKVFGAGQDLASILATLGAVQAGDGNHFSIGGPPDKSLPVVGGLLGQPRGISNAHNRFEGDGSPARGDLYQFGEAYLTKLPFFQGLYDLPGNVANPNYDLNLLGEYAVTRYKESVAQNPYYFRGFFGLTIPPGTHAFIVRMFANHSAANPDGFLGRDTLKSFYAMSGPDDKLVYSPGNERIPENWYTRAADNLYTVPLVDMDLSNLFEQHPELVAFGGNTGTVNSFAGLNIADLTGGAYNAETLLQGNNLACFLFQSIAVAAPDLIRQTGVIADVLSAVNKINSVVAQAISGLGCPQLSQYDYDSSQLSKYPGYTKLTKQGTY